MHLLNAVCLAAVAEEWRVCRVCLWQIGEFYGQLYLWYFLLIANVAIAISAVGYGAELMDATMTPLGICIATIVVLWICTIANFGGARITGQISSITVWG